MDSLDWSTSDFDGDEMNLHVPQSLPARAEAELMMLSPRVVVSGTIQSSRHGYYSRFSLGRPENDQAQHFY